MGTTSAMSGSGDRPAGRPELAAEPPADRRTYAAQVDEQERMRCLWLAAALTAERPEHHFDPAMSGFLGLDMTGDFLVVLVRRKHVAADETSAPLSRMRNALRMLPAGGSALADLGSEVAVVVTQDVVEAFDSDRALATTVRYALQPVLPGPIRVGISRSARTGRQIPTALAEARLALDSPAPHAAPDVVHIADVRIFGLLTLIRDTAALARFRDDQIGPLAREPDLLATLEVLLGCNFAVAAAARRMHVHYNTVRYRLDRVVQILGPIEDNPQRLLAIQLALYIRRMLPDS